MSMVSYPEEEFFSWFIDIKTSIRVLFLEYFYPYAALLSTFCKLLDVDMWHTDTYIPYLYKLSYISLHKYLFQFIII